MKLLLLMLAAMAETKIMFRSFSPLASQFSLLLPRHSNRASPLENLLFSMQNQMTNQIKEDLVLPLFKDMGFELQIEEKIEEAPQVELPTTKNPTIQEALNVFRQDYTKCIQLLEQVADIAAKLAAAIQNKQYEALLPLTVELGEKVYEDYECWIHAITELLSKVKDVPECVIDHLKLVLTDLKLALADMFEGHMDDAVKHLDAAISVIQDIANCH